MVTLDFDYSILLLGSALFALGWIIQLYYLLYRFLHGTRLPKLVSTTKPAVSIVICARNEERNLMKHIPLIMEQDYPKFELIIVNDSSWDDTEAILKAMQVRYSNIHVVALDEEKQIMQGKKFALTLGIKASKYDTIVLTDADCAPQTNQWLSGIVSHFTEGKEIVIGVSLFHRYKGYLNRLIRFDGLMTAAHYIGFAQTGQPYMGVGRNMAYHRDLFFKVGGFKRHYTIAGGDDDLFINQVATAKNTAISYIPSEQTISEPKKTWQDWFVQKRRHLSTSPYYQAKHKRMLFLWPLSFTLMWLGLGFCLFFHSALLILGGLLLIRYILQIAILHKISKRMGQSKDIAWLSPILEIHHHLLNAGLYFSNLLRKPQKWN